MTDVQLRSALERLAPQVDDSPRWDDVAQRASAGTSFRWRLAAFAVALALVTALASTPRGQALVTDAFDQMSAWIDGVPGEPASKDEQQVVGEANARSVAPIPDGTELGLLVSTEIRGVRYDLLGFRDRGSLCLRLRSSVGVGQAMVRAEADCVSEQLLIDLAKPVAVFSAADPVPRAHVVALYGLASDDAAAVELKSPRSLRRVLVKNNAFLHVYEGESPRLTRNRLDYRSDVPFRATAMAADGPALGSVTIMSLKRGYPAAPAVNAIPGPVAVERDLGSFRVGWLDRGEARGEAFEWRLPDKGSDSTLPHMRSIQPSTASSLRVLVSRCAFGHPRKQDSTYCLTHVWPLSPRPNGFTSPGRNLNRFGAVLPAIASAIPFDAQFPVHYGLVADGVESLELYLSNGAREEVPIVDNVFAVQVPSAYPAKLVAYDQEHRVVAINVLSLG
jgi:hypothetical protein